MANCKFDETRQRKIPAPMSSSFNMMIHHPDLQDALRDQARAFLKIYDHSPRLASVFGTHQRWLLGHLAMAQYFSSAAQGSSRPAIIMARYLEQVKAHRIASVNTADAFVKEMVAYGIGKVAPSSDRRNRPIVPSEQCIGAIEQWLMIYLGTLDRLHDKGRLKKLESNPGIINCLYPSIVDGLLTERTVRQPPETFSLFTWLNNGGIVLDWLIAGTDPKPEDPDRILTQLRSVPMVAETFRLSRTHLTRKLREAESLGSIGWEGTRGRSRMWVSPKFLKEYESAQIGKMRIVDDACAKCGLI